MNEGMPFKATITYYERDVRTQAAGVVYGFYTASCDIQAGENTQRMYVACVFETNGLVKERELNYCTIEKGE